MASEEETLSTIPKELFEQYKAPSINVNLTDGNNNLRIVPSQIILLFCFTTRRPVVIRNGSLYHLIRLLEGTEKPILTVNCHRLFSNEELAAILRNATKNVDNKLNMIHVNFQNRRRQQWTDCSNYYCKTYGSSHQIRGRYIRLEVTICSVCRCKRHGFLS